MVDPAHWFSIWCHLHHLSVDIKMPIDPNKFNKAVYNSLNCFYSDGMVLSPQPIEKKIMGILYGYINFLVIPLQNNHFWSTFYLWFRSFFVQNNIALRLGTNLLKLFSQRDWKVWGLLGVVGGLMRDDFFASMARTIETLTLWDGVFPQHENKILF